MTTSAQRSSKRPAAIAVAVLLIGITLIAAIAYLRHDELNPLSEDAALQANIVHISAAVPGQLIELAVEEGARVKRGDLLFRLDPTVYELQLQQAEAGLEMAQAVLSTRGRQIRAEAANAAIADEQITRARTNLELAERTLRRLQPLAAKGYVPQQQLDTAATAERDARISLTQALSQAEAARELVGEMEAAEAAVTQAQATLGLARKALADTEVHALNDGLVVGLLVSPGERLAPGQSLFTLINSERWYATAFFRETDLLAIRGGNCAVVYTMIDPTRRIEGRVDSIGWGVNNEDMISLPRALPYVQKSLNWVRVAQRFPVRILLQDPPEDLMRMGASATVAVRPGVDC
ncbi:multidrug transporter subunit MdtN [Corticimicrobacter populi]|uniref:Multidrug transporter subunit MdtN n=1 Tax=Corticimicrobacter populi TaxID=2175229 RepID=A0A2V1K0U2_9BURK|nr:multidrug transporter subunit MdtN [Corticimicrobacter populi]PWF23294.1 multidrug transporter subunit MdtN [Corticimicrobacter populi]